MADSTTPNYSLTKPEEFASTSTWGGKLNDDLDILDTQLKAVSDVADAAAVATTALQSTDGSLSGVGDWTANRDVSVVANKTNQKVAVSKATSLAGTRKQINFIEGPRMTITLADNAATDSVDATFEAADSAVAVTEALSTLALPSSVDRHGFDGVFLTTTETVIATVPASKVSTNVIITVTNNSTSVTEGYSLWAVPNAGSTENANILSAHARTIGRVKPGESVDIELPGFVLGAGATIVMRSAATTTTLSVRVSMETAPDSDTIWVESAPAILTTSLVTLRTVGALTSRILTVVYNYSAVAVGVTVAYRPVGQGDSAAYNVSYQGANKLKAGERRLIEHKHKLADGDEIRFSADAATSVSARTSTAEIA